MASYNAVLIPPADLSARIVAYAGRHFFDIAQGYCLSEKSLPHVTLCQFKTHGMPPRFSGFPGFTSPFDITLSGYGAHYGRGPHQDYIWVELLVHKTGPLMALQKAVANYLAGHNIKPLTQGGDYYRPHVTLARMKIDAYQSMPNIMPGKEFFGVAQSWQFACGKSDRQGQFLEAI